MRSQEFLAKKKVEIKSRTSTKQQSYSETQARGLLEGIEVLISLKGRSVVRVDLRKAKPGWVELAKLMIGPTGKLRAPVIRKGKTLIIGFHNETYCELLA
ncbi:MAG: hypothetical protein NDJ18_05450 [candidate division Zixibacteria bacterium]|nr:hypothetical protein [candidate division Zixibacteria bacterium]